MTGEKIESLMYDWLTDNFPEGAVWLQKHHGLAELPPLELRMLHPLDEIEYNIGNGGWAQFHWNHFSNWPEMLATAHAGYTLIGALAHAEAMNHLGDLCHRNDEPCYALLQRAVAARDAAETEDEMEASVQIFAEYMKLTEAETGTDWERLFYGTDIHEKRLTWLEANGARILAMIGRDAAWCVRRCRRADRTNARSLISRAPTFTDSTQHPGYEFSYTHDGVTCTVDTFKPVAFLTWQDAGGNISHVHMHAFQ